MKLPIFAVRCLAAIANIITRLLVSTYKINVSGLEHLKNQKTILMLWHNKIIITPQILHLYTPEKKYSAFVSNSRDGELMASFVHCYKKGSTIRVPHDLRHESLRKVINRLKNTDEIIVITPDGPRGPPHEIKGGIVVAARQSGAVIVPMSWKANRYWEFNTWDKMMLPKPFAKVDVVFGSPITLSKEDDKSKLEAMLRNLDHGVHRAHREY